MKPILWFPVRGFITSGNYCFPLWQQPKIPKIVYETTLICLIFIYLRLMFFFCQQEITISSFRVCVKDLAGMESQHDPVTVDYAVIGGIKMSWLKQALTYTIRTTIQELYNASRTLLIENSLILFFLHRLIKSPECFIFYTLSFRPWSVYQHFL